jgi:DNA adenine methylase
MANQPSKCTRPILRYHGGKWKLAPRIIAHFPTHRIYVEAFGGAASILMRKHRVYCEVYNDLDGELVNLFRVLRERGDELARALELTPFAREEFDVSYEPSEDPLEQARRTVVRSYQGFGSNAHVKTTGFRSNANRSGTTPAHDWRNYPASIAATIDRLRGVILENKDAMKVMLANDGPNTLHYVDPPYVHSTRQKDAATSKQGYRFEMTDAQHRALAKGLEQLEGAVILSGYHSALYDELYGHWRRVEIRAMADGAKPRLEVLWMRNVKNEEFKFD